MSAVRMFNAQFLRCAVEFVNRRRCLHNRIHAAPFEIGVADRRVDKDAAWRERADQLVEIERNVVQTTGKLGELRHIARLAPATFRFPDFRIAAIIIRERVEAATGDDHFDAWIKYGGEYGVVSAQRMANRAELPALDERQRFEQIESADVVPNSLHRAALVAERLEVRLIIGEQG